MKDWLKENLPFATSLRFWLYTISIVLGLLVARDLIANDIAEVIMQILSAVTGGAAFIGTVDKAAINAGKKTV